MINRRLFLSSLLVSSASPFSALSFAGETSVWSEAVFKKAYPIVDDIVQHPFFRKLIDGTLPRPVFLKYLEQNSFYLKQYARSLSMLASRMDSDEHLQFLVRNADSTIELLKWTATLYKKISGESLPGDIDVEQSVELYAAIEAQACAYRSIAIAMACILPCFWVYREVGRAIAPELVHQKNNPYKEWLDAFGDEQYSQTVDQAVAICNALASEHTDSIRAKMNEYFLDSCQMELQFFEVAFS